MMGMQKKKIYITFRIKGTLNFFKTMLQLLGRLSQLQSDPLSVARQRHSSVGLHLTYVLVISTSKHVSDWPDSYLSASNTVSLQSEDEQMLHCAPDALQTRGIKSTKEF